MTSGRGGNYTLPAPGDFYWCSTVLQKFFQFLGHHFKMVQHLAEGLPHSALLRWREVVAGLQAQVERVQRRGLDEGVRMQETLQVVKENRDARRWSTAWFIITGAS